MSRTVSGVFTAEEKQVSGSGRRGGLREFTLPMNNRAGRPGGRLALSIMTQEKLRSETDMRES